MKEAITKETKQYQNVTHKTVTVGGVTIFYREAGKIDNPTILMLHGFPSSSHMYRDIIEPLAEDYHIIAPDYPGFGFSAAPSLDEFEYSFDNISGVMDGFITQLELSSFYLMMQDYGGPIGFRIAAKNPKGIKGLIIQNANLYFEGLGEWAQKIGTFQKANDMEGLKRFKDHLISAAGIKEQYLTGAHNADKIDPISYLTDTAFMDREGIREVQSALFSNYGTNFPKYPEWQNYLEEHQPSTLIVWGENDKFFGKAGAEAYRNDLKNPNIYLFNSGHFMLEEYALEVVDLIKDFIK